MRRMIGTGLLVALLGLSWSSGASATTVPFTEEFASGASDWRSAAGTADLTWVSSGGPDGGSYASASFNYFGFSNPFGGGPVIFRGHAQYGTSGASGGAFIGNWTTDGVQQVSAWVRHDTGVDLTFFLRVASTFNFPGAVFAGTDVVTSGEWTLVTFDIDPLSPLCIGEGVSCAAALASIGNVQLGTSAPAALTSLNQAFTLDVDQITVTNVPEPGTLALLASGLGALAGAGRRRR